jgi:hypothetical protein
VAGGDEGRDLGPPAVDGAPELSDFGDVGVSASGQELPVQVADVVTVGAGAGGGEQAAQLLLGDPGRQGGMPTFPVSMSSFHRVVN